MPTCNAHTFQPLPPHLAQLLGENHNLSWNCGEEGPTACPTVNALRQRQLRNFAAALLLAQGVPMLVQGDEYGHSKRGNNNTYCHDSALNWLDWAQATADVHGLRRFWTNMIKCGGRGRGCASLRAAGRFCCCLRSRCAACPACRRDLPQLACHATTLVAMHAAANPRTPPGCARGAQSSRSAST